MNIAELSLLYALVGTGSAAAVALTAPGRASKWLDAGLTFFFWPLYGPFLLAGHWAPTDNPQQRATEGAPHGLGVLLEELFEDSEAAASLHVRLKQAQRRAQEIDALLKRPDYCPEAALHHQQVLEARGDLEAATATERRLVQIRHLQSLQSRAQRELNHIDALIAQLRIQIEVARLTDRSAETCELMDTLKARLEGLDVAMSEASAFG